MKTAIKLALIYFGMQILAMVAVLPFAYIYSYIEYGNVSQGATLSLAPSMLVGFLFMGIYLWRKDYLNNYKQLFSVFSISFLLYSILAGISSIFVIECIMSFLSFFPDLMKDTFNLLQSGWLGILCIAVLGPILEELLFRGAITKVLLQKYSPLKAILLSGLIFGVFHLNPVQVVGGVLSGFLFAWIYYKSGSLIPTILIHIINNSLSVYMTLHYPKVDHASQIIGEPAYLICMIVSVVLLLFSLKMINSYKNELTSQL